LAILILKRKIGEKLNLAANARVTVLRIEDPFVTLRIETRNSSQQRTGIFPARHPR
jgi:sRNA-binding carbon storage regulator CsrA